MNVDAIPPELPDGGTTSPTRGTGVAGVTIGECGLDIGVDLDFEDWQRIGLHFGLLRDITAWALGDWILAGEVLFGEAAAQGVEVTGRSKATLIEFARVARRVPRERRRPQLTFTHHQLVAAQTPEGQAALLDRAVANGWSCEELRGVIHDPDRALSTRPRRSRSQVEILELVEQVAREVLNAAEPLSPGYRRVPQHALDRLANALGVRLP